MKWGSFLLRLISEPKDDNSNNTGERGSFDYFGVLIRPQQKWHVLLWMYFLGYGELIKVESSGNANFPHPP